jgi:TDG/mug DNA glycosylase family protein
MSVLPDLLAPALDIVFCGTAVGTASARRGAYYAGPGNAFWPTLFKVGLTPRLFAPEEYRDLKRYGLGLTDLAKTVSGADRSLSAEHFDCARLRRTVLKYRPGVLAFTSKRAAREFVGHPMGYGLLRDKVGETALFVLPSPSGAARRYWSEAPWRELSRLRAPISGKIPPSAEHRRSR